MNNERLLHFAHTPSSMLPPLRITHSICMTGLNGCRGCWQSLIWRLKASELSLPQPSMSRYNPDNQVQLCLYSKSLHGRMTCFTQSLHRSGHWIRLLLLSVTAALPSQQTELGRKHQTEGIPGQASDGRWGGAAAPFLLVSLPSGLVRSQPAGHWTAVQA